MNNDVKISVLIGRTLKSVKCEVGAEEVVFECDNGDTFKLFHSQDCCESVTVEDVTGELDALIDSPIIRAEESTSKDNPEGVKIEYQDDSFTWTFYKFATVKGWVDIRFYGSSNGYYSEEVDFAQVSP